MSFAGRTLFAVSSCDALARQESRARASMSPLSLTTHHAEGTERQNASHVAVREHTSRAAWPVTHFLPLPTSFSERS